MTPGTTAIGCSRDAEDKLCRDLGIEVPIISAPLGGGGAGPELASAGGVSPSLVIADLALGLEGPPRVGP
jgi:hypothetical protein